MSLKPILNDSDALNNKSLNLYANSINSNLVTADISADELDVDVIKVKTGGGDLSIQTSAGSNIAIFSNGQRMAIDELAERTANNGIIIDGSLLKDNELYGSQLAGGNLSLNSTSDAVKGIINCNDDLDMNSKNISNLVNVNALPVFLSDGSEALSGDLDMGSNAIQNVASGAVATSFYEYLSGAVNFSGPWAVPVASVLSATRVGQNVTITITAISSTATVNTFITLDNAIDARFRPDIDQSFNIVAEDNSTIVQGRAFIASATGVMTIYVFPTTSFTAANNAGFHSSSFSYILA